MSTTGEQAKNASALQRASGRPGRSSRAEHQHEHAAADDAERVEELRELLGRLHPQRLAEPDRERRERVEAGRRVRGAALGQPAVAEVVRVREVLSGVEAAERRVGEGVPDGDDGEQSEQRPAHREVDRA